MDLTGDTSNATKAGLVQRFVAKMRGGGADGMQG